MLYKLMKKLAQKPFFFKNFANIRYFNNFQNYLEEREFTLHKLFFKKELSSDEIRKEVHKSIKNKVVIPFMDLSITNACTLSCRKCSQWFPYLKEKKIFSANKIIKNLDDIFKYVDLIYNMVIIGGEPFLNKEIDKILEYATSLCDKGKIKYLLLVTNGTIFPSEKVLKYFQHPNLYLFISNYPLEKFQNESFLNNRKKLLDYAEKNLCNKYEMPNDFKWFDYGDLKDSYKRNNKELNKCYDACMFKNCSGLYDGVLYKCGRVYTVSKLKNVNLNKDEYIDFSTIKTKNEIKKRLKQFYSVKFSKACDYCSDIDKRLPIEPAEQLR